MVFYNIVLLTFLITPPEPLRRCSKLTWRFRSYMDILLPTRAFYADSIASLSYVSFIKAFSKRTRQQRCHHRSSVSCACPPSFSSGRPVQHPDSTTVISEEMDAAAAAATDSEHFLTTRSGSRWGRSSRRQS